MPKPKLPDELTILEIAAGATIEVFRNVQVAAIDNAELVESFRSHKELGLDPRREEITHPVLHGAISCWTDPEINRRLARYPALGDHIARLVLKPDEGFTYMDPSQDPNPKHRRIWGDPLQFVAATAEIFRV